MVAYPQTDEYAPYYGTYIRLVPQDADLFALMAAQPADLRALLHAVTDAQASQPPKPGEWSIKEVIGHLNDTERVFAFRAFWIGRGDTTPLPGFDQDVFVRGTDFNQRTLNELLDEFAAQRQANLLYFKPLTPAELERRGTASGNPFTPRALLYAIVGHVLYHVHSLKTDYGVGG